MSENNRSEEQSDAGELDDERPEMCRKQSITAPQPDGIDKMIVGKPLHSDDHDWRSQLESDLEFGEDADPDVDVDAFIRTLDHDRELLEWAVEMETPSLDESPDEIDRATIYGSITQITSDNFGEEQGEMWVVADRTGSCRVVVPAADHAEISTCDPLPGDDVIVTQVEATSMGDDRVLKVTRDSEVGVVRRETGAEHCVERRSKLRNAHEWYSMAKSNSDAHKGYGIGDARHEVVKTLLDEFYIETPRGQSSVSTSDLTVYMYTDDPGHKNHGTWVNDGRERVSELLQEFLPASVRDDAEKNKIVARLRDETRVPSDIWDSSAPDSASSRWTICVENGTIDIRTGELGPHDPSYRHTNKFPVEYDGDAELGPEIDDFLDTVTESEEDRELLLALAGHSLPRAYPTKSVFFLMGGGNNGKTVWMDVLTTLLGSESTGTMDIGDVSQAKFVGNAIEGNHLAVDDDVTGSKIRNVNGLKRVSGGGIVQIDRKHMQKKDLRSYATLSLLANDPPIIEDKTPAVKSRVEPIVMPTTFTRDPSKANKDGFAPAEDSESLKGRLMSDTEMKGLLSEAVKRSQELFNQGEITVRSDDESWRIYEQWADTVQRFWTECLNYDSDGARLTKESVYATYCNWSHDNGVEPVSDRGRSNFWTLSKENSRTSFRDGVYVGDQRAIEHVTFDPAAVDHMPGWAKEKYGEDVKDGEDSGLMYTVDSPTPIADLGRKKQGYVTVDAVVIDSPVEISGGSSSAVKLVLQDSSGAAIDAIEWFDGQDSVLDGITKCDRVRITRGVFCTSKQGVPQILINQTTDVDVVISQRESADSQEDILQILNRDIDTDESEPEPEPEPESDTEEPEPEPEPESDTEEPSMTQEKRKRLVKDTVSGLQETTNKGASIEDVVDELSQEGIDEANAKDELESLRFDGEIYQPGDGHYRCI